MARHGRAKYPFESYLDGWNYWKECKCGGTLKVYFRKGNKELRVMPNKNRFEVTEVVIFGNRKSRNAVIQGSVTDMKTLLAAV